MHKKPIFKKEIIIGKDEENHEVFLEIELRECASVAPHLTIDLEPVEMYIELAICGNAWNNRKTDFVYCGQIYDMILENVDDYKKLLMPKGKLRRILEVWERWHLNGMRAGTRKQNTAAKEAPRDQYNRYSYDETCNYLKKEGIYEDRGYKYGHAWLVEVLPDEIIEEVKGW